ncbi:hypothetical protein OAP63_16790 [Vibrio sp.]|uniref:Uncharacterized protein n=1 Tax=Vibrio viridaestus TaxID=2487322 RepID=A0A3N9TKP2_9VIBR|nr:hypothetical protein [Vibrio viridaestus]MDC0612389.1 hypothetical protein [Vibrio sp.]RQW64423.1 hypothetical protein EES38_07565 [Vibrio viridaestus]
MVKPITKINKLYRAAKKRLPVVYATLAVSIIAITVVLKFGLGGAGVLDTLTSFHHNLFSKQYTEQQVVEPDTTVDGALLDVVGENLTLHSVTE